MIANIEKICQLAREVIETEAGAILELRNRIDDSFIQACQYLYNCEGRIIVIGMGKSGHIGSKIAATFASTGSPAFFLHPGEANHGDIGIIVKNDVVIAISNSGTTPEITAILPTIKRLKVKLISLTGNPASAIAKTADVNLDVSVAKEACPLGLAPTSSTTAALAMGDALATALLTAKGFTAEDFARIHPGGTLGKRLSLMVDDIMRTGDALPLVEKGISLKKALVEISQKRMGMAIIVDKQGEILGVFTDGDLRRAVDADTDIFSSKIEDVMHANCKTIPPGTLAIDALQMMENHKITSLIIAENNRPLGVINMHDLLTIGLG